MYRVSPNGKNQEEIKMEKWINMVETNCSDPSREREFNDWYDNMHVPDVLKTPGFVAVTRYASREFQNGRGKHLAIS